MSNAEPAHAASLPEIDAATREHIKRRRKFDAAYTDWLAAKLACLRPCDDESDEAADARCYREDAAQLAFIDTPAPDLISAMTKLELVEALMVSEIVDGPSVHPRTLIALAAVKTDFLAITADVEVSR